MAAAHHTSAWSITRKHKNLFLPEISKYAVRTGQVMWAWNKLQRFYQELFTNIVSPHNQKVALAAWQTIVSDQAQRDMLEAAAGAALVHSKLERAALKNIKWALNQTRSLAAYRNIAAHMPVSVEMPLRGRSQTIPDERGARETAIKIVKAIGDRKLFISLVEELYVLGEYVQAHKTVLFGISPGEFPRKPRLRLHRLCQQAIRPPDPPKAPKRKRRRRQPPA